MKLNAKILSAKAIDPAKLDLFISELSCLSEPAVGDGLVVPFSQSFLKEMLALEDSYVALCQEGDKSIGFAIFQNSLKEPPEWVRPIAKTLSGIQNLGYANLIVIARNYRGDGGGYDVILNSVLKSKPAAGITFITMARLDNERAVAAHRKRGWRQFDHESKIILGDKECVFSLFGLGSACEQIASRLAKNNS